MTSLKHGLAWATYKFTSTVLDDIWPGVLFFTGIATMVVCVSEFTSKNLGINSIMLTVLGTIVSLVVSFKTNSSYARWWDGRNIWANIASNSRQLAMLLWIQVPNVPPSPKNDMKDNAEERSSLKKEEDKARAGMQGLIEKKTYIGLVQAFAVSMKHALRGEAGPFYSDLYSLIAFLPKYNPSAYPPVTRDHLLALWQNGLPREHASKQSNDTIAVPLTTPIAFTADALNQPDLPVDEEKDGSLPLPSGRTTGQSFRAQAIASATSFVKTDNPKVFQLKRQKDDQVKAEPIQPNTKGKDTDEKIILTTVELLPPRHPPMPKVWDFFPLLRIGKVVYDWWKKNVDQERQKGGKRRRNGTGMEIPQEILMYLFAYISDLIQRGLLQSSLITPCLNPLLELQKSLSDLEKIATTPLPSAYTFHLRLTVYIYLFFLPFQVYTYVRWVAIPATAVAAVIYLGFLEIGMQIEMPFAYDQSDLDLDQSVLRIAHQIAQVTAFPTALPALHVVLSHLNQPFLPTFSASAPDILGVPERQPRPTPMGIAEAWSSYTSVKPGIPIPVTPVGGSRDPAPAAMGTSTSTTTGQDEIPNKAVEKDGNGTQPDVRSLMKSIRDIELILNANWREITLETEDYIGKPRDQLENRTGLEVAVLAL
ncbi:hypothetical protein CI109_100870 [Kwoniella shandongensis]|uniref:Uncharacterized protein n=1 Tax=Kwoniella shandongensis TaxID=1734106 RepID=A0A5M6BX18_9TREE|nr:uncharacterized protein CI109_006122 [Kwoniella shandongensis]KAA5525549.1 hypothetical protein CI109_006122 [Kwoniella shandongensis]